VSGWFRSARFVVALLALCLISCASHSDKTKPIRTALDAAQPRQALAILNDKLEVDSEKEIPDDPGGDNALYLLDRSMVLQALGQYAFASRDLELSDKQIEVLDLSRGAGHELGKYLFSDDAGPYKAPAYEKLLINTMGMVNYLARGDLNGARIEARRLTVMQKYLSESEGPGSGMIGPGSYLAGFAFEKSGKPDADWISFSVSHPTPSLNTISTFSMSWIFAAGFPFTIIRSACLPTAIDPIRESSLRNFAPFRL
jgi:hypothetical protein